MTVSRRGVLAGLASTATVAVASAPDRTLQAATAPAGRQVPGTYRHKLGSIEITAVTDGAATQPLPDRYVRNAGQDEVRAALARLRMARETITAPFTPLVVNTGSKLVVVDTGMGPLAHRDSKGAVGQFHDNLNAAGIARSDVDAVVISHIHRDHINGLLTIDDQPAFPNAEIMVPAAEWNFWRDDGNLSRMTAGSIPEVNFKNAQRVFGLIRKNVTLYAPDQELAPGITAISTPGHTPGHCSHLVTSGSSRLLLQADLTAFTAMLFVYNPGWHVFFDMDGAVAEQSRRRIYDMVVADDILVHGYHFPFPALGRVEKDGTNYRLWPAPWNPTL